jgi:hypothetical protein
VRQRGKCRLSGAWKRRGVRATTAMVEEGGTGKVAEAVAAGRSKTPPPQPPRAASVPVRGRNTAHGPTSLGSA